MENQMNVGDQNTQQIGQNPINQQPISPEKPKINYLAMTGVVLVCFVVFGFGGYYLGKQSSQSQKYVNDGQNQVSPTATPQANNPTPTTNPSSTSDPTANWKTYTNTEYNYMVNYPSSLVVGEDGMGSGNIQKTTALAIYQDTLNNYNSPRFAVAIRLDNLSLKDIVTQHYNKLSKYQATQSERETASKNLGFVITDPVIQEQINQTTMFGLPAYTYTIKSNVVDNGVSESLVASETHKYIWLERNNKFYLISYTDVTPINQILSTFKFTN